MGPSRLTCHTWWRPCISVVPEAIHKASWWPLKGVVSAEKALQGSKTKTRELLGGMEENSVSSMRGHWFALQANQLFFTEEETEKIELVAGPVSSESASFCSRCRPELEWKAEAVSKSSPPSLIKLECCLERVAMKVTAAMAATVQKKLSNRRFRRRWGWGLKKFKIDS